MRALVIDDSRSMRSILKRILLEIGFKEVSEAGDGLEALDRLKKADVLPDLVLVDWNMPRMDGYQFIRTARANSAYRNLRLMMVTTESEVPKVAKALEAGADEYVMKPFTGQAILEKLQILGLAL